jgi:hypothetical protein
VYSHCLFCSRALGRNEALEAFPVGRRLAYDAARGRLWAVCTGCGRWNLTPLDARWEAIEQAERLFRRARVRASTDNIGLARVADRTELVRVGRPTLPEFASWRYADVFARRRRRAAVHRTAAGAVGVAIAAAWLWGIAASGAGASAAIMLIWRMLGADEYDPERERADAEQAESSVVTRVVITQKPVSLTYGSVRRATIRHDGDGLALTFPFGRETRTLVGERAVNGTAAMLTFLNAAGAAREFVDGALDRLVAAGSAERFLAEVGRPGRLRRGGPPDAAPGLTLAIASAQTRLALEIALNDERERRAMEGELAALERAWRDAEAIAAIADGLALPGRVERAFARLRGRGGAA